MAAATTTKVSCPINAWTVVATARTNVIIQGPPGVGFRVAAGASEPSDHVTGPVLGVDTGVAELRGLTAADLVYVCPIGSAFDAEVIAFG